MPRPTNIPTALQAAVMRNVKEGSDPMKGQTDRGAVGTAIRTSIGHHWLLWASLTKVAITPAGIEALERFDAQQSGARSGTRTRRAG